MRSFASTLPAAAGAAFLLLTAAGASRPVPSKSPMPAFKRWSPVAQHGDTETRRAEKPEEGGTLLDEVGRLSRRVEAAEVAAWKRELRGVPSSEFRVPSSGKSKSKKLSPERVARLHLWLGEYKLAQLEDPAGAYYHFRAMQRLTPAPLHPAERRERTEAAARDGEGSLRKSPAGSFRAEELARLKGRAVLNIAIGRFKQGAYEEAHHRFRKLLHPKTMLPGYDRREVALWHRHAAACFGYHQRREQAGITEPEEIDPECGAASLAVILRSLGMPFDRKSVLKACRVTGFGSSLQDLEDAAGAERPRCDGPAVVLLHGNGL